MQKLFQNQVAENSMTLTGVIILSAVVWLLAGGITHQWWIQTVCLGLSTYLLIELSNSNTLIRIRSRMVTCMFLLLTSAYPPFFGSSGGNAFMLCFIGALMLLFFAYQNKEAVRIVYYAFICWGLSSLFFVQILYFLPVIWLMMILQLQALSLRTWLASIIGIITPYWFLLPVIIFRQDFHLIAQHFSPLTQIQPIDYGCVTTGQLSVFGLVLALSVIAIIHFWTHSYEDRIRVRLLYSFFVCLALASIVFLALQPQHFDILMRMTIICLSPYIGHFFTLTHTKATNYLFIASCVIIVLITVINLFPSLQTLLAETFF